MPENITQKMPAFICEICDFKCCKGSNYKIHIETDKHKRLTETNKKMPIDSHKTFGCGCGKKYNHLSSLAKHKRNCIAIQIQLKAISIIEIKEEETDDNESVNIKNDIQNKNIVCSDENIVCSDENIICSGSEDNISITKEMFMTLLKDNQEMMKMIKSLSEQQLTTPQHITNNNNITNNFNLNIFLNEKCKDALNMSEFIDSIKITLDDLLFSKTNGITRGVTDVMMKRLKELDIYKRPIHCTDIKRDTMYIKDEDKWEKDNNHDKFKNTIVKVANKERSALQQWAIDNPDWIETEQKQIKYLTMVRSICEPIETYNNYERKIVKNIGKEILVEK